MPEYTVRLGGCDSAIDGSVSCSGCEASHDSHYIILSSIYSISSLSQSRCVGVDLYHMAFEHPFEQWWWYTRAVIHLFFGLISRHKT